MKPHDIVFVEEWQKAALRLTRDADTHGGIGPAVTSWLLKFAETPLETLSLGQRGDLTVELLRFAFDKGLELQEHKIHSLTVGAGTLGLQDLIRIQQAIRTAIDEFLDKQSVTLPQITGTLTVTQSADGSGFVRFGGDLPGNTFFMMATLLAEYGHRVRRCRNCNKLTLVARRDKLFCSQACQMASWRKEKTDAKPGKARTAKKR